MAKLQLKKKAKVVTCDYLVLDMSNILYRTFFTHKNEDVETVAGLAMHSALMSVNKFFKTFKPRKKIVMAFDRPNWRKVYTKSDECISKKIYKGNRRQNMTAKEKERYEVFINHIADFENMMRDHSSAVVLAGDLLEADDLISGMVQTFSLEEENSFVIVSSDKDLIQLLGYPNVTLINPQDGKERSLEDWGGDSEYFLFEKCIRGDTGDNVQSSFPRCKSTRIRKAFDDPMERVNLMHETWKHVDGREFMVKELFNENRMLMDLRCQPEEIQKDIIGTVLEGTKNPGTFSYFHFMKFLGKFELKKIAEQAEVFTAMLSR